MKIFLYYIGKARNREANALAAEYVERIGHYARCEMREVNPAKFAPQEKHASAVRIYLDPAGRAMNSGQLADWMGRLESEGREAVFIVGGAEGLPEEWKKDGGGVLLSLSPMTFPHEMARAMVAEQIYRAFTILRGHPYPR
jgi:23S rRNA (pseudouridine1915-N3)-methyltransferase